MKRDKKFLVFFFGIASIFGFSSFKSARACSASKDPRLNYFISYEKPYAGLFTDGAAVSEIRPTIIDQCQQSTSQFLMIGLSIRTQKMNGRTGDISFTNKFTNDSCKISNNPFKVPQTYEDKLANFENQYKLLRSCTFYDIVEIDENEILLPDLQPAATVEKIERHHIRATGDFLYIRIRSNNRFAVSVGIKKECTDAESIKKMGLEPSDLQALLNFYIAGDASGITTDLTSIGSTRLRLALTPGSELMNVSAKNEPKNIPSWPSNYKADVDFGSLTIKKESDERSKIDFIPLVDNTGIKKCVNNICSSENSFQSPVAGYIELKEVTPTKNKVIDSWYFGSIAPSQYQGFIESLPRSIDSLLLKQKQKYILEMTMVDPFEDYTLFKNGFSQYLIDLQNAEGVAGLDVLQSFAGLSGTLGLPVLSGLGGLNASDASEAIGFALKELNNMKAVQNWPPYYDQICIQKGENCFSHGRQKFIKKIKASFELGALKEDRSYTLEHLILSKVDPKSGEKIDLQPKLPSIECRR